MMRGWMLLMIVLAAMFAGALVGCGGERGSTAAGTPIRLALNSATVSLSPGATHTFTATVSGATNTAVSWSVIGGQGNGTITTNGVYTAPNEPGSYTVVATSQADPGVNARATITVQTGVNITIAPQNQTIKLGDTLQFTANVTGGANTNVTWLVQGTGSGGEISNTGLYTAPLTAGTYTVTVRSAQDATRTATTQVTVVPGTEVKLDFPTRELVTIPGSTVDFKARVVGTTNRNLTWSVQEASGGAINSAGRWTAPTTPGTYTVVATSSADPTKRITRTVKVVSSARLRLVFRERGEVVVQLNTAAAPNTSANMVSLFNAEFYPGTRIHRVESSLIQGGSPLSRTLPISDPQIGTGGPGYTIPFENTGIAHVRGVISMARTSDPNSAGSQWFIVKTDTPAWDGQYASFGTVQSGLSVVDAIQIGDTIDTAEVIE